MSGICAVLGPNNERIAKETCNSLRHRGPDDEGLFVDRNLALGHTALQIGNTPAPHQPLSNEDQTVWITFDGKIYNEKSLTKQLEKTHTSRTNSSAEVVVHAYEEYGFRCLDKFNGMFAFCLWDSKKKLLFSARDRIGMKPLYYCQCHGRFILASEIKAILAEPSIIRKPNGHFIYEYLVTGHPSRTGDTFFLGVKELMPAHYLAIDASEFKIKKYWQPTRRLISDVLAQDDDWCALQLRKLLRDSIRIRLPENAPVGTFLSGGLDSTSIAFLVHDILKSKPSTATNAQELFSAIHEEPLDPADDESPYIEHVEHKLNAHVNYVVPSLVGQWNDVRQFVLHIEEPVAVFGYYVFWRLFQAAKEQVKIVFSGQGADTVLSGETRDPLMYLKEMWRKKQVRSLLHHLAKSLDWMSLDLAYSMVFKPHVASSARMLLGQQFVRSHSQSPAQKEHTSSHNAVDRSIEHAYELLRVDDRASSAFSMECRHPFLDHRIVEFAFSLPAAQKFRNGWTKYVMRNAMKGLIPEAIRTKRRKSATPIPQQRWMRELYGDIRKLFASPKFGKRQYFNQPAVLEVFDRYCEGTLNRLERPYYPSVLWRILNLELWLETFFDSETETELERLHKESMDKVQE